MTLRSLGMSAAQLRCGSASRTATPQQHSNRQDTADLQFTHSKWRMTSCFSVMWCTSCARKGQAAGKQARVQHSKTKTRTDQPTTFLGLREKPKVQQLDFAANSRQRTDDRPLICRDAEAPHTHNQQAVLPFRTCKADRASCLHLLHHHPPDLATSHAMATSMDKIFSATAPVALVTTGLFAGAALYISAVDVPSSQEEGTEAFYRRFPHMYRRAAPLQATLAGVGATAAAITAAQGGHCSKMLWGASAALIGSVIPYTILAMMPTNKAIIKQNSVDEVQKKALLARWARLHLVRTVLSCTSFGLMAWTMHAVKPRDTKVVVTAAGNRTAL